MERQITDRFLMQIEDERSRLPDGMFERTCLPRWEHKLEHHPLVSWLSDESKDRIRRALTMPLESARTSLVPSAAR
jgi:hypothetical protein